MWRSRDWELEVGFSLVFDPPHVDVDGRPLIQARVETEITSLHQANLEAFRVWLTGTLPEPVVGWTDRSFP